MRFELRHAIKGDLDALAIAHDESLKRATTQIIRNQTRKAERQIKRHIQRANFRSGGGDRVARDVGSRIFPERGKFSTGAVGYIYSKAGYRATRSNRPGRFLPLFDIFQTTYVATARRGTWLAIPTAEGIEHAGRARGREITPRTFPSELQFVRSKRSRSAFLVMKEKPDVVAFILVRRVTVRRRLNILPIYLKNMAEVSEKIAARFDRHFPRQLQRAKR